MCRPHGTAFLPPDVCRRKERKEQKKEKKGKEKKRKKKTATLKPGIPSLSSLSNHRTQPTILSIFQLLIFSSSHLHSSKNPPISMLNSNLAYSKNKRKKKSATSNKSVCPGSKKKLTFHRTTIMSTLQIRADFLLHNRFGSAETTCPTRTRFLHHYPDTNKHISFIRLINLYEGDILFCVSSLDIPKEQQVYYW